jgi:hypothetical protein
MFRKGQQGYSGEQSRKVRYDDVSWAKIEDVVPEPCGDGTCYRYLRLTGAETRLETVTVIELFCLDSPNKTGLLIPSRTEPHPNGSLSVFVNSGSEIGSTWVMGGDVDPPSSPLLAVETLLGLQFDDCCWSSKICCPV